MSSFNQSRFFSWSAHYYTEVVRLMAAEVRHSVCTDPPIFQLYRYAVRKRAAKFSNEGSDKLVVKLESLPMKKYAIPSDSVASGPRGVHREFKN